MSRYKPVGPFEWPKKGQRTWTPPEQSFFGKCNGRSDCDTKKGCPVGLVVTVDGGAYGCDCPCHVET